MQRNSRSFQVFKSDRMVVVAVMVVVGNLSMRVAERTTHSSPLVPRPSPPLPFRWALARRWEGARWAGGRPLRTPLSTPPLPLPRSLPRPLEGHLAEGEEGGEGGPSVALLLGLGHHRRRWDSREDLREARETVGVVVAAPLEAPHFTW